MLMLSELYGRIGQILQENGDMEVTRMQNIGMDNVKTSGSDFYGYDNTDFYVHQTDVCSDSELKDVVATHKRFVINPFGNGVRSTDIF